MSCVLDDTAADVPVRDTTVNLSQPGVAPPDSSAHQQARVRRNISKVSREELEDRFLRLYEETLQLKQHIHIQDDKIRKLGTKLMRLVKDRGRMEQLAVSGAQPPTRLRDVEMEEMMEELQEKVRGLQAENEGLKKRLLVAKQQLLHSQNQRSTLYGHVQPRVNSGLKRLRDDMFPSQAHPRSMRSLDEAGRPPTGQLPRYGHSLLEEARAEIRSLENVVESQQSRMEEQEGALELLREQLKRKEEEYEENLLQARQHHSSSLRSQVNSNMSMIRLQKQLADRSTAVTELESRFLQLQEAQRTLKASHEAAMEKVDELSAQLKDERLKSLDLDRQRNVESITKIQVEQLQEQIKELEQERELLKENNQKLMTSVLDDSEHQKWQLQEQQLKLQIAQLETALKADLLDKNQILDRIKFERDTKEQLTEDRKNLQVQLLEQKQQVEELKNRLEFYSREDHHSVAELSEALLLIREQKSLKSGALSFLGEVAEEASSDTQSSIRELRAAHIETIQELEKTRNLLNTESRISKDYKAELEAALQKMNSNKVESEQKLEYQAQLLDAKTAKITRLEAQLRDFTYGTKTFRPELTGEDESDESDGSPQLEHGENVLELQIVGATLSPAALQLLGDTEPSTFCTYVFYLFELHSTPVVTGRRPQYGFTSKYVVSLDQPFLDHLHRGSVTLELHQALGLDWRTLAMGQLQLQQLLMQDGKVHGSVPLVGTHQECQNFGSVDYWFRLKIPMMETVRLYREKLKAVDSIHTAPSRPSQLQASGGGGGGGGWNELFISVQRCSNLQARKSKQPSPYVVYKFFTFPDHPTATIHDCPDPDFSEFKFYSVLMDGDLDRYLKTEVLQFYVFDYKEEQEATYLGKAGVLLLPLTHNQVVSVSPIMAAGEPEEKDVKEPPQSLEEETSPEPGAVREKPEDRKKARELCGVVPHSAAEELPPNVGGQKSQEDGPAAKRVTFVDATPVEEQVGSRALQNTEEEDDEEESHVSEGQLVPSAQSFSDDSDMSDEVLQGQKLTDVDGGPAAADPDGGSTQSDSDDCIVQGSTGGRKASDRVRVEVVSLSLTPRSRLVRDDSVVRLFVEYNFLDLPTEETPLSLPKPAQGRSINYNYSKVIPVDGVKNGVRRRLLRDVLQGRNPDMERVRFMVVSEPPEEEEQERECEDVGVAYLRIPEILEKQEDLIETSLRVLDLDDSSEVLGSLTVSVEGLEVLRAILEDRDLE